MHPCIVVAALPRLETKTHMFIFPLTKLFFAERKRIGLTSIYMCALW